MYYIGDFGIDSSGSLFLLANDFVVKYSNNGELLKHYPIKIGQGPGEFNIGVNHIYLDPHDKVYIEDNNKLVVLSNELTFEKNVSVNPQFNDICFDDDNHIYVMKNDFGPNGIEKTLCKFDLAGKLMCGFTFFSAGGYQKIGGLTLTSEHEYKPKAYYCIFTENIYYSYNFEYAIGKFDLGGRLVARFVVDEKPTKMTTEEKDHIIQRTKRQFKANVPLDIPMDFPSNRPYLSGLKCDEKGRIYAVRFKSILDNSKGFILDIFANDGRLLYSSKVPYFPKIINKGTIYALDTYRLDKDSDLSYRIIKLTVKNYDLMKSEI